MSGWQSTENVHPGWNEALLDLKQFVVQVEDDLISFLRFHKK